ncbi:sodium/calcium exchanger 3-like protein, partial [Dinothrombium tinctorium]
AEIPLQIIDNESYEKDATFYVELFNPIRDDEENGGKNNSPKSELSKDQEKVALQGIPRLGEVTRCEIRIKESKEFKNTVDKLFRKANTSFVIGASSWKEQFIDAIPCLQVSERILDCASKYLFTSFKKGEDDEKLPSCSDYVMHFFTLFWKVLFAFVPSTDYLDGWVCFVVSILVIVILTAIIGDLASHLGFTINLKDTVTAIAFVALGTSVPGKY